MELDNSLTGELFGQLINAAIRMLHEIGITVRSLTYDGAGNNVETYESFRCALLENDFSLYFLHKKEVFIAY